MKHTLYSMCAICLLTSPATTDTSECGTFKFETPNIYNGELFVKESTEVNITFTILNENCTDVTFGYIDISKTDNTEISELQCRILSTCINSPSHNRFCHCLGWSGFYSISFVASRKDNAKWVWSVDSKKIQNAFLNINVTYSPSITHLQILEYETYIPKSRSVTVECSWVNGNPPTKVILLDRHNSLLKKGDKSGNVSHTFQSVGCSDAGVIRCEADGSDRNRSTIMLIKCPPEFTRNESNIIQSGSIGHRANFTFLFRSHTTHISSCHMNQILQNTNVKSDVFLTVNCTEAFRNGSTCTFGHESKHCLYCVTGEPPDLQLTIHMRDLKKEDGGPWYVTISNGEGTDVKYFHFSVKEGSDITQDRALSPFEIAGIVTGVTATSVIVVIIGVCIIKGKDKYARPKKKGKKETVLYRGLGTDTVISKRLSGIYYEIQDSQLDTDLQTIARKSSVDVSDLPPNDSLLLKSTNVVHVKSVECLQSAHEENETSISSDGSSCIQQINIETSTNKSHNAQQILVENQASSVIPVSDYLKLVRTGNETNSEQQRSEYLKIIKIAGKETNIITKQSDYLEIIQTENESNHEPLKSDYLKPVELGNETSIIPQTSDYLDPVQTVSNTSN